MSEEITKWYDMLFEVIFQCFKPWSEITSMFYNSINNCERIRLLKIDPFESRNLCVSTWHIKP